MTRTPLIGAVEAPSLHVMSWNIRRRLPHLRRDHPDRWDRRAPLIRRVLREERPHVLGVQEALPAQAESVLAALGDGYRRLGRGRGAEGAGEGCPLFYDSRRLEVRGWRQLALSEQPWQAGSRGYGSIIPRVAVVAELRDLETGGELTVVNTHLDPLSRRSRVRSAQQIRELVSASGRPAVVTGDFNAGIGSESHRELADGVALRDPWARSVGSTAGDTDGGQATDPDGDLGTFANYRAPRAGRPRLDWILVSPDVGVERIATSAEPVDGAWPSDHLAVHAVIRIPATGQAAGQATAKAAGHAAEGSS